MSGDIRMLIGWRVDVPEHHVRTTSPAFPFGANHDIRARVIDSSDLHTRQWSTIEVLLRVERIIGPIEDCNEALSLSIAREQFGVQCNACPAHQAARNRSTTADKHPKLR